MATKHWNQGNRNPTKYCIRSFATRRISQRQTQLISYVDRLPPPRDITRTYDGLGRLTQEVTPEGTVNYTYDNADRLTQVQQGTSTTAIAYAIAGRRTSLTLPNTNSIVYAYNAASDVTSLTYKQGTTTLGDLTYTYEPAGNRIKTGGTFARTNLPPALTTTNYNSNNQQTTFGTTTETYDLNDNLTTTTDAGVTTTYTWNARNQLTSISGPGLTASFSYDSFGRRTGKTINGTTTNFVYDGLNPLQEKDGGTVTANLLTGLGIDEFFTRTDGVGSRVLLPDALGSTVALGDGTGTLQTQYTYEPFGYTTQIGAASTNSYKYTGREDDGSGLMYYRARYYQPRLQRFISEDPIEFGGRDFNVYAYVHNNPNRFLDPLGLEKKDWMQDPTRNPLCFLGFIECDVPPAFLPYVPTIGATKPDIKAIDAIQREVGLSNKQRELLHEEITGRNLSYKEIKDIAQSIKKNYPNQ